MRTSGILILLAAIGATSAYALEDNNDFRSYDGFSFKLGMPVLKASTNGTDYATLIGDTSEKIVNMDSSYHPGYSLGIGYQLPRGSELNLDWFSWQNKNSNSIASDLTLVSGGRTFIGFPTHAKSDIDWKFQGLDFTAGQRTMLSPNFALYYYGGLNYTHVEKDMHIKVHDQTNAFHIQAGTDFKGVGPEFGLEGTCYPFDSVSDFGITGGTKISFPYGTLTGYVHEKFDGEFFDDHIPKENVIVPTLGANIGVKYDISIFQGKLGLQTGWQFTNYFNVTKSSNYEGNSINVSSQGPYFNIIGSF